MVDSQDLCTYEDEAVRVPDISGDERCKDCWTTTLACGHDAVDFCSTIRLTGNQKVPQPVAGGRQGSLTRSLEEENKVSKTKLLLTILRGSDTHVLARTSFTDENPDTWCPST